MKNLPAFTVRTLAALRRFAVPAPRGLRLSGDKLDKTSRAAVQAAISKAFARHRTIGGSVALVRGGQLLDVFAYGNARLAPAIPATPETIYRVASVSKLVFTFAVMKLVEEGTLTLDMAVEDALGYPVQSPAFPQTPITLRHLLTHTSGLRDAPLYDGPGISGKIPLRDMFTPENAEKNFAATAPGTFFYYSNFGSGIVGAIIEAITGAPFDDTFQRVLFAPLGITASYMPQRLLSVADRLANGYAVRPLRKPTLAYDAPALATQPPEPADPDRHFMGTPGRLLIAAPDAAKLLRLLGSDGAIDGVRILQPDSIEEMRVLQDGRGSVQQAGRGLNVAFAPQVFGRELCLGHQGVAYGMNAELWLDPATGDGVFMATSGTSMFSVGKLLLCGWEMTCLGFEILKGLA